MKLKSGALVLLAACALTACNDDDDYNYSEKKFEYSFDDGLNGWQVGFADYTEGQEESLGLDSGITLLPAPLDTTDKGLMIAGDHGHDGLFMFVQRKVEGLLPNTTYSVQFDIELGSAVDSIGENIFLKAGVADTVAETSVEEGMVVINLDKGEGEEGGEDLIVLGDISNGTDSTSYALIERNNSSAPISFTTNENGEAWLIFGTDAIGLDTTDEVIQIIKLYYTEMNVIFREIPGQS